jgi:hypothetical protein
MCLQSLACEICPGFMFHSVLVGMLSSRVVLMFLLSCWQANLANEKNKLAGQVKKLMRDVAKVVSIKAIWTAKLCFEECVLCIGVVLCRPCCGNTGNQVFFCEYDVTRSLIVVLLNDCLNLKEAYVRDLDLPFTSLSLLCFCS